MLKFGSLPVTSSPVKTPTASETSSIMATVAEGNLNLTSIRTTLDLTHTEVILGLNSEMSTELFTIPGAPTIANNTRNGEKNTLYGL